MTTTTTTKNMRYHMALGNGGTRYIDIENPIDNTMTIAANINTINQKLASGGDYEGILVSPEFFDGETEATVTSITSAEIIEVQKTVTKTNVF